MRWRLSRKAHKKTGGRVKGVPNKASSNLKELLDRNPPDEELWKFWKKKLYSRDEYIALRALELTLHYRYGKPKTADEDSSQVPTIIDISAIPMPKLPPAKPSVANYENHAAIGVWYKPRQRLCHR